MELDLNSVVTWLVSGGGAAFLLSEAYRLYHWHRVNSADFVIKNEALIIDQLNYLKWKSKATKVLILATHNGGDKVQVGKRIYSSVTHEVNGEGMEPTRGQWQNQVIDEEYTKLLLKMISHPRRKVLLFRDKIPKDLPQPEKELSMEAGGNLKRVYQAQGIDHTIVAHVYSYTPKARPWFLYRTISQKNMGRMWYMSLVFTEAGQPSYKDLDSLRIVRNKIGEILHEQYKYD